MVQIATDVTAEQKSPETRWARAVFRRTVLYVASYSHVAFSLFLCSFDLGQEYNFKNNFNLE